MWQFLLVCALWSARAAAAADDECSEPGVWGALLEDWAVGGNATDRHGRVMSLPPSTGYYVSDRVDRPPPPPHPHHYTTPSRPHHYGPSPPPAPPLAVGPVPYEEWQSSPPPPRDGGKIINRPSMPPNKDKFKPSPQYPGPSEPQYPVYETPGYQHQHQQQQHQHQLSPPRPGAPAAVAVDRIGEAAPPAPPAHPPRKQVSETDLYLLSAIEKLVWRADLMEKRLRKVEESLHYLIAGTQNKPEPCVANFSRVGESCYHFSSEPLDWKSANLRCRKLRANLLELETEAERRTVLSAMMADKRIRGMDIWTGGLNPGLLWIWSHSARPIAGNGTAQNATAAAAAVTIVGEGRCLAMVHEPAINNYVYRGQDCAFRHRFICEKGEDKARLGNEIERVAKALRNNNRQARLLVTGLEDNL